MMLIYAKIYFRIERPPFASPCDASVPITVIAMKIMIPIVIFSFL